MRTKTIDYMRDPTAPIAFPEFHACVKSDHHDILDEWSKNNFVSINKDKKPRRCLKCTTSFISEDKGHRICNSCKISNRPMGALAEYAL